jgi:plastocyanin
MLGYLGRRERSSGIARARLRTLALGGAVLVASLVVPTTLVAAPPAGGQDGSAEPPGAPAPPTAEQPSPPTSPAQPAPPSGDRVNEAQQPQPAAAPAGRRDRGRSAAASSARPVLASASAAAKAGSVSIVGDTFSDFAFSPKTITVHAGDKVRWDNDSAAPEGHTVTGDDFDSGTFHQGEDYVHRFSRAGNFKYICALHPAMKGKVTVLASGGGSSSGGGGGGSSDSGSGGGSSSGSSAGGSSGGDPAGSGQLPVTGLPLGALGVAGLGLVALGLVLRRWAEYV